MAKTITFAAMHFSVAFAMTYLITGSLALGGTVAVVEPLVNTLAYHVHERLWAARARTPGHLAPSGV